MSLRISRLLKYVFIILFFSLFFLPSFAFAQTATPTSTQQKYSPLQIVKDKQEAIKNGTNQEAWLDEALGGNLTSGIRALSGDIPDEILNGQYDPNAEITYIPGGAVGGTTKLISSLYNPPASGIEYIAQIKNTFLGKPAMAQGVGFNGLSPILPIWKTFRNAVYLLSSIIFIIIGVMIIFRVKINPQTVISLQNAVPQIVIALVLVTFSYAIAGLLIDFVYVIQSFFIALLFNASSDGSISLTNDLFPADFFGKVREFFSYIFNIPQSQQLYNFSNLANPGLIQFFSLTKAILPSTALIALSATLGAVIGGVVGVLTLNPVTGAAFAFGSMALGGPLLIIIVQIIILVALFRFFLALIKAYITVLLKIILAPLEIGAGALPNSKLNFSSWLYELVANLAIFPASIIFIVIVNLIVRNSSSGSIGIWAPSPIAVAGAINIIPAIIGLASILMLPKLPDLIHQVVFQLKPSPWGGAIGETVSTFPMASGAYKSVKDSASKEFGQRQVDRLKPILPGLFGRKTTEEDNSSQASQNTDTNPNPPPDEDA